MKYTLLELVQLILSAMDSEEVNSINDTVESTQVSLLLKALYFDLATELGLPEHETLFQLDASGDNNLPVLMTLPSTVTRLDNVKYDKQLTADTFPDWQKIEFKNFADFMDISNSLREETTNIGSMNVTNNSETFEIVHRTNLAPDFYTTTDDFTLIFDSFDTVEDTTLQKSKTMCQGSVYSTFTLTDGFTPDLDPTQFSYYINRAKVRAFTELKQVDHAEAAGESRQQKVVIQKKKRAVEDEPAIRRAPNYGRKR